MLRAIPYHFFVLFCASSLLLLSGCGSRNSRSRRTKQQEVAVNSIDCTLHVEGVECQFCAESVVAMLKALPGVLRAEYHASDDTYEDGYASFMFDTSFGTIAREQLNQELTKEGFELVSLSPDISNTAQIPNQ